MHCSIWYHLYKLKNMKNTHEGVLLLVKQLSSVGIFHIFLFEQMVPNRAERLKCNALT